MTYPEVITLAIEAAIGGGSLSLLRGDVELCSWVGDASSVMKAENLLVNVDRLLSHQGFTIPDVGLIAVSAGPGSFTGIRIGIATSLGLKMGLSIKLASVSALEASVFQLGRKRPQVLAALPVGRNAICIQRFEAAVAADEPKTIAEEEFYRLINEFDGDVVIHGDLYAKLIPADHLISTGNNIAGLIGKFSAHHRDMTTAPMFVAKSF